MSSDTQHTDDCAFPSNDAGLSLDNAHVQSFVDKKITLELFNETGTHLIPINAKQAMESLYGILKTVAVDGKSTYEFTSFATVVPNTIVAVELDKDLLTASFANMTGTMDMFTLVPKKSTASTGSPGLFLTRSGLRSGFDTVIVVTIAEVGPGRDFRIQPGRALESVTGVFETLKFPAGAKSWRFERSYDVQEDSGILLEYHEGVPTAYFTDVQGDKRAVGMSSVLLEETDA